MVVAIGALVLLALLLMLAFLAAHHAAMVADRGT
jgi:hypothetical protein